MFHDLDYVQISMVNMIKNNQNNLLSFTKQQRNLPHWEFELVCFSFSMSSIHDDRQQSHKGEA